MIALHKAGIQVEKYYSSEVDKYAIQVSEKNCNGVVRLGDIRSITKDTIISHQGLPHIDLIVGGSPCQDLSIAKKNRKGLDGERSGLFWEYLRLVREIKPTYFLLENVASMPKGDRDIITRELGVEPIMINAALVSAQNRKRLFWTNIPNISQPEDRGIKLADILVDGSSERDKSYCIDANYYKGTNWKTYISKGKRQLVRVGQIGKGGQGDRVYSPEGKSVALSANGGGRGAKTGLYAVAIRGRYKQDGKTEQRLEVSQSDKSNALTRVQKDSLIMQDFIVRKLTPVECERLQNLPDGYTEGISNTRRYQVLGNAFNVEVVAHILRGIKCAS